MFGSALFYPTIDIRDEEWLKSAFLFWDSIYTIVPSSLVGSAYRNNTTNYLNSIGFLRAFEVTPGSPVVQSMVPVVKEFAQTEEGKSFFARAIPFPSESEHGINPYEDKRSAFYLHREKLPYEIQRMIGDELGPEGCGWARVSDLFADYYMTLLANEVANSNSLALLSSNHEFEQMSLNYGLRRAGVQMKLDKKESEGVGRSLLTKMVIGGIKIDPLTSFDDLQFFKDRHIDELRQFRIAFDELAKMDIQSGMTIEGVERMARDIYENRFLLAYKDLQKALRAIGIRFLLGGAASFTFTSLSGVFDELLSSLSPNHKIVFNAGVSLLYSGCKAVGDRKKLKRGSGLSYLLSIDKGLNH